MRAGCIINRRVLGKHVCVQHCSSMPLISMMHAFAGHQHTAMIDLNPLADSCVLLMLPCLPQDGRHPQQGRLLLRRQRLCGPGHAGAPWQPVRPPPQRPQAEAESGIQGLQLVYVPESAG